MLDITKYPITTYKKELSALITLALPMLLAQVAQVGTGFVDTVMAGGAGIDDLAAVALGNSLFATVYVTLMGVMSALNPMIAEKHGANGLAEIGEMGRQGLWYGLMTGVIGMLLMWAAITPFQNFFDLSERALSITGDYLWFVGLAMPAAMIHRALHAYASSLNRPRAIMIVSWLCFFINIPLNWIFVYGKFGMPALGGAGCGLATAIVFWVNAIVLGIYIAKDVYFKPFGLTDKFSSPNLATLRRINHLGLPIGLSFFIEVSLFTCIMFLVARLKGDANGSTQDYVAAQQIVISLTTLIYMLPQSIGTASTVRTGFYLGKQKPHRARYVAGIAVFTAILISCLTAVLLVFLREPLAKMYTDETVVIGIAATVILFAAAFQVVDAIQTVASYALRGYQVTHIPMAIHLIAFWGCGLIPGYFLATYYGMGIYGFWLSLVISLTVAAILLLWYLERYSLGIIKKYQLRGA
ncbi:MULTISPECIES: MATE family efflux transporter [unclassified Moraxella]|uniref:MATE family efflux transporter n=1 Tax=unclassified Moraxella TaxID=2685852 RepID=UPI00359D9CEE